MNLFCQTPAKSQRGGGALGTNLPESELNRFILQEEKQELTPFACSVGLTRPVCWFALNSGRCFVLARSPGEVVIGNTNLSTFHFTVSSSVPLPKPGASQKIKRRRESKETETKTERKRRARRRESETVEGEGTRGGNVFLWECLT